MQKQKQRNAKLIKSLLIIALLSLPHYSQPTPPPTTTTKLPTKKLPSKKTPPKCDKTQLNFFLTLNTEVALQKLFHKVSKDILSDKDSFGQGLGKFILRSHEMSYKKLLKYYEYIRRDLGIQKMFKDANIKKFEKYEKKSTDERKLYTKFGYSGKIGYTKFKKFLEDIKIEPLDYVKKFHKELEEAEKLNWKVEESDSADTLHKKITELHSDYKKFRSNAKFTRVYRKSIIEKFKKPMIEIKENLYSNLKSLVTDLKVYGKLIKGLDELLKEKKTTFSLDFLTHAKNLILEYEKINYFEMANSDMIFENIVKISLQLVECMKEKQILLNKIKDGIYKQLKEKYKKQYKHFIDKVLTQE